MKITTLLMGLFAGGDRLSIHRQCPQGASGRSVVSDVAEPMVMFQH
jgi:hypothetical protein